LAFIEAGVPTSTFYRARVGKELRYKTALKVLESIDKLSSLQENN
jgi:predicted transcriptional regulator